VTIEDLGRSVAGPGLAHVICEYVAGWNTAEDEVRGALFARSFAEAGTYQDPSVRLVGREALVAHGRRFAARWPGARIQLTSGVDDNGATACFTWHVRSVDGSTLRQGIDVVRLGDDGRIIEVQGFFGDYRSPRHA
jgi:hypothetical protein